MEAKYIRTKNDEIIVFSSLLVHSEFKRFEPKSAGFINILVDDQGNTKCICYGMSISLDLESNPKEDTELATRQILLRYF